MKKVENFIVIGIGVVVLTLLVLPTFSNNAHEATISFNYTQQTGTASNQYAIWVEDADGEVVKPIFVTLFSARGGWKERSDSLPLWVEKIGQYSNGDVDAISTPTLSKYKSSDTSIDVMAGSTPQSGYVKYVWTLTDMAGQRLKEGVYTFVLEATLRSKNRVVYRTSVDLKSGAIGETRSEFFGDSDEEHSMVQNVIVRY